MRMFAALLMLAASASAQQGPFTLSPDFGPSSGGAVVLFKGRLGACPFRAPCVTPSVTFGDLPPVAVTFGDRGHEFAVRTPPHRPGVVDIAILGFSGQTQVLHDAYTFVDLVALHPDLEGVLIPIAVRDVPGANNSLWRSELTIFNSTDREVYLDDCIAVECNVSPVIFPPPFRAGEARRFDVARPASAPGTILWVPRAFRSDIDFSLRIRDLSRQSETLGTEIPVIRENDLEPGAPVRLMSIPTNTRFRSLIRVYDFDGKANNNLEIRGFSMTGEEILILRAPVPLARVEDEPGEVYGYAQIPLESIFGAAPAFELVRVEIRATESGTRLWGFVSVTNNETQQVTLITPQ